MCFSSLVLSRRPKILKKRPQTLKKTLTPIGSCRDLHILYKNTNIYALRLNAVTPGAQAERNIYIYIYNPVYIYIYVCAPLARNILI